MPGQDYQGFRFEISRPDGDAPGGERKLQIIAVAQSEQAAMDAVSEIADGAKGTTLLESGSTVLEEARRRGIGDGMAVVL